MTGRENALRKDLFTISANWADLLDLPKSAMAAATHHEAPMPLPVGVLSLRFDAAHQLAAWAHLVHDERHLSATLNLMDTPRICGFLATHAAFLATHAAGADAAEEIGRIATHVSELIKQTRARRYVIGQCPDCAGLLHAVIRNTDALLPSEIRCTTGTHAWTPWEWSRLGERIRRWDEGATRALMAAIHDV